MQGINPTDLAEKAADIGVTQVGTSSKATIVYPNGDEFVVDYSTLNDAHRSVLLNARGLARATGSVAGQGVETHGTRVYLGRWIRGQEGTTMQNAIEPCPRCRGPLNPVKVRNALSRVDNQTYVCSSCGTNEAMFNLGNPGQPLPPVTQPVFP